MCLQIDNLVKLPKTQTFIAYKLYCKNPHTPKSLLSLSQKHPVNKPGAVIAKNKSNKEVSKTLNDNEHTLVDFGIHVYLNKKNALNDRKWVYSSMKTVLVPVICHKKHLRATGYFYGDPSAVFTQITISRKTWNSIFPKTKKKLR